MSQISDCFPRIRTYGTERYSQLYLQILHSRLAFLDSPLQALDVPLNRFTVSLQSLERCPWLQMKECISLLISVRSVAAMARDQYPFADGFESTSYST